MRTKIESSANSVFKKFLSLTTSKGLKAEGLFILGGEKLIREFLQNPHLEIDAEVVPDGAPAISSAKSVFEMSRNLFNELDTQGTHFNLLIVSQPLIKKFEPSAPQGLEVICPLGDPGNLGAIIRSAEAFGMSKVILTQEAAHPFLPKAVKAAAGSLLRMPLFRSGPLVDFTSDLIALDQGGLDLEDFSWPKNCRLMVGEEGPGLSRAAGKLKFQQILSIRTRGVESLNAVVAASLAFHDYARKTH